MITIITLLSQKGDTMICPQCKQTNTKPIEAELEACPHCGCIWVPATHEILRKQIISGQHGEYAEVSHRGYNTMKALYVACKGAPEVTRNINSWKEGLEFIDRIQKSVQSFIQDVKEKGAMHAGLTIAEEDLEIKEDLFQAVTERLLIEVKP